MGMKDDLANRSREIRWPEGFAPDGAEIFAHNELYIEARAERIWRHLVEAARWPEWYPNAREVRLIRSGNVLARGAHFSWTTFGVPVESRVNEFLPFSRIAWFGYAPGTPPSFCHAWHLVAAGSGCQVITEEVGTGSGAIQLRETDEELLHRGHDVWLATLKRLAES